MNIREEIKKRLGPDIDPNIYIRVNILYFDKINANHDMFPWETRYELLDSIKNKPVELWYSLEGLQREDSILKIGFVLDAEISDPERSLQCLLCINNEIGIKEVNLDKYRFSMSWELKKRKKYINSIVMKRVK